MFFFVIGAIQIRDDGDDDPLLSRNNGHTHTNNTGFTTTTKVRVRLDGRSTVINVK